MLLDVINAWNSIIWGFTNALLIYIGIALVLFVAGYYILFDPRATTGGKLIFRFALSLTGVMLVILASLLLDPAKGRGWMDYATDIAWWRPTIRLLIYGYVAYTITSLTIFLGIRKWRPHRIKTEKSLDLVQPRHETGAIQIMKEGVTDD